VIGETIGGGRRAALDGKARPALPSFTEQGPVAAVLCAWRLGRDGTALLRLSVAALTAPDYRVFGQRRGRERDGMTRAVLYPRRLLAAVLVLVTLLIAAVPARAGSQRSLVHATLILDFLPNAVHAGIYHALAAGYYRAAGIDLTIIQPTSTSDTLKLIAAGKADFGIADGLDVAEQIAQGQNIQAIMALVERPLVGLITLRSSGVTNPKQFEGKLIGITGTASDRIAARTIVTHAGGNFQRVHLVTIGFNGPQALESGRIAAFTGFWPDDGTQVQYSGFPTRYFPLDQNGGPRYPGLVFFATRTRIAADPGLMRAFIAATVHGYEDTLRAPARSLHDLLAQNPTLSPGLTNAVLKAYLPLFQAGAPQFGYLVPADLNALSNFLVRTKLIAHPFSAARYGTNRFLPSR
jgi:putative hydroxymethylpyrimidine transport system substrate-binding protein